MNEPTILVVDDEPSISEVVGLYLRRAGYRVMVARDGQEALQATGKTTARPGRARPDVTQDRRVRDYPPDARQGEIPIIMLTSRREETDRILGLEMGADDYVVKPFSPRELVSG